MKRRERCKSAKCQPRHLNMKTIGFFSVLILAVAGLVFAGTQITGNVIRDTEATLGGVMIYSNIVTTAYPLPFLNLSSSKSQVRVTGNLDIFGNLKLFGGSVTAPSITATNSVVAGRILAGGLTTSNLPLKSVAAPYLVATSGLVAGNVNITSSTIATTPASTALTLTSTYKKVFVDGNLTVYSLALPRGESIVGGSNAYACLDKNGRLFRSKTPCVQ